MSYHFIDKKDPRIDVMFQGLEKMERMLSVMEDVPRSLFNGERFLTDEELSKVLRVSRRTLQEYRTFGVIPYYLVQGKALYKESDIMKILDDAYKRCREEQQGRKEKTAQHQRITPRRRRRGRSRRGGSAHSRLPPSRPPTAVPCRRRSW